MSALSREGFADCVASFCRRLGLSMVALLLASAIGLSSANGTALTMVVIRVVSEGGSPLPDARVALVPPGGDPRQVSRGISDLAGRATFSVPPGTYAITATLPGHIESFVPGVKLERDGNVETALTLRPGGRPVYGRVVAADGTPVLDADVAFGKIGPQDGDLFLAASNGDRFAITLTDGEYALVVTSPRGDVYQRRVRVSADVREQVVAFDARPSPASSEVKAWIKQHLIPLKTVEAGNGFADLAQLKPLIGTARVVSIGEATHGTREFFQMKHRLLEYLVEELGFTLFGMEASLTEARAVNDYVLYGRGDPSSALKGLYFWTWNTEEVLEMLRWMRLYNERAPVNRRVQFFGFDMQEAQVSYEHLRDYLRRVDTDFAKSIEPDLALVTAVQRGNAGSPGRRASIDDALRKVAERLDTMRAAYLELSTQEVYANAREDLAVLRQYFAFTAQSHRDGMAGRDQAMAQNVLSTLDRYPGARAVLWAHNGHIGNAPYGGGTIPSMGMHLRQALGRSLLSVGLVFRKGEFQSFDVGPEKKGLTVFQIKEDPGATLANALASADVPIGVLDLRRLPVSGEVSRWFGAPQKHPAAGGAFASTDDPLISERVVQSFDALLFIDSTTRARPTR